MISLRGGLIGNTLLIGGMVERCIYTSERLHQYSPDLYFTLRAQDLDLFYFLLEPALNLFVEALKVRRTPGQPAFDKIIDMVEREINGRK